MGDRRCKKIRAKKSSEYSNTEEAAETPVKMGRTRHVEASGGSSRDSGTRDQKRKHPTKERWLLTRKTWRYMADAGRRLIPEGAQNRSEDIPKIESYFQRVCSREPRFLLWRKSSYPGALGFRSHHRKNRSRKKGGSCREKASSADEAETFMPKPTTSGRFDLQRLKQEFLYGSSSNAEDSSRHKSFLPNVPEITGSSPQEEEEEEEEEDEDAKNERELLNALSKYLRLQEYSNEEPQTIRDTTQPNIGSEVTQIDYQKLVDQLRSYLSRTSILESEKESESAKDKKGSGTKQQKLQKQQQKQKQEEQDTKNLNIRTTTYRPLTPSPLANRESFEFGTPERMTLDILKRYYSKSTCRQKVITDLLTDRKLLEKLYTDLRKTRSLKSNRTGYVVTPRSPTRTPPSLRSTKGGSVLYKGDSENDTCRESENWTSVGKPSTKQQRPSSLSLFPPPLIEIYPDYEPHVADKGIQTDPIPASVLVAIQVELKKSKASNTTVEEPKEIKIEVQGGTPKRRSSVDNDDVSPSVSDTIKRYLRMARKKSLDSEKVDRFKRVNYDRNLRNIKPKSVIPMPGDDDGLNKGCQTDESWITALKELKLEDPCSDTEIFSGDDVSGSRVTSSRSSLDGAGISDDALLSPPSLKQSSGILSSGQTFLSNLLHGLQQQQQQQSGEVTQSVGSAAASVGGTMQKSKSSSSVVHHGSRLVAKNIWRRNRSKSQSRATSSSTSTWTPQGNCSWSNVTGRQVTLGDLNLLALSEVERRLLQKVAVAKLQALNLGVTVRVPSESVVSMSHKPKRRPYLLKRKALTTGFFDTARGKDDKDKENGGLVFGIPISQCLENDRLSRLQHGGSPSRDEPSELRRKSHHGSRTSCSSLIETSVHGDERGSCESLMSPSDRMAGSVPGLLDTLSCGSATDITGDRDPSIPLIVQACFRHLENYGLHTLGIFRVSSSKKRVRQLREDFDCGKDIVLGEEHCAHDVATLLKEFFRDLPEPLLCRDLYHAFIQTQKIRNRRLQFEALQHLIQLLPIPNRDTLWALLNFLVNVARNSDDHKDESGEWMLGSKMDSNNLATVFAPNILHCIKPGSNKELSTERAEERIDVINVIRSMIDHNKELFKVPADLLDEVYLHMMDTHPEALDLLLRKRGNLSDELIDDLESSTTDLGGSETSSVPRTPTQLSSELQETQLGENEEPVKSTRRVWSREEFLHETAGMGGPDMSMRPRNKDRDHVGQHSSKKRWKEEPIFRKKAESVGGPEVPKTSFNITTSASASQIAMSSQQKLPQYQFVVAQKSRSSSVDGDNLEAVPQTNAQVPTIPGSSSGGSVITASLKIPMPSGTSGTSFTLNVDDTDIPYIEDSGGGGVGSSDTGRQQMKIGLVRHVGDIQVIQQRSGSGSDSSQASVSVHPPTQLCCDSALGSTATFSSPPYNATPSICSSDAGVFSSPPSWASTPPTSPEAMAASISFMPEEITSRIQQHHMQTARISIATSTKGASSSQAVTQKVVKEAMPVILQKVTFTSTSELKQVQRSEAVGDKQDGISVKSGTQQKILATGDLPKSASTTAVIGSLKKPMEPESLADRKYTTSISTIGGAVMRSKTADIERMLKIRGESSKEKVQSPQTQVQDDKKKISKRRYTDSRHQTKHIPDPETLHKVSSVGVGGSDSGAVASQRKSPQKGPVWKRRELIASDPKDHESAI